MSIALSSENKFNYSKIELEVLSGVIDYADRMIREEEKDLTVSGGLINAGGTHLKPQAGLYQKLRRQAYAKTIVIDSKKLKKRLTFRLTSTEAAYPNLESGYCTPHSPVGHIAVKAHPGDEDENDLWGEYCVIEVRLFERYAGPDFAPNVRNFLRMTVDGDAGQGNVTDLRSLLLRKRKNNHKISAQEAEVAPTAHQASKEDAPRPNASTHLPPPIFIDQLRHIEASDHEDEESDLDEDGMEQEEPEIQSKNYYGLSEQFFTHQTAEQNQIISRSPIGAMFVDGIAGSGKTSAALGRTKMLTTFNRKSSDDDEASFRKVVGNDQAYWSSQFSGKFSEDSCVGFVRTGELINYLKETCRRIDLPHLPVLEYKELQIRLCDHRILLRSNHSGRGWTGLTEGIQDHRTTTMAWLRETDRAVAHVIGHRLLDSLPSLEEITEKFDQAAHSKVNRVVGIALERLRDRLQEVTTELLRPQGGTTFALDRLAVRLLAVLDDVRSQVLGPKVLWTRVNGGILFANNERDLALQLIQSKAQLYLQGSQRLVFVNEQGPVDLSLQLLTRSGEPLAWDEQVRTKMTKLQVLVREPSGKCFYAIASDADHLFLRLGSDSSERIFTSRNGDLIPLPRARGWGRERLPRRPLEDIQSTKINASLTPDAEFKRLVQQRLLQPLIYIADTYLTALQSQHFSDTSLATQVRRQLERFKLGDADIDMLLCLSHLAGRGFTETNEKSHRANASTLCEPSFYQAVFIDEVQDFTEQQVFLMVEQANPTYRAVTIAGDLAQKLHHGTSIDLKACFPGQTIPIVQLTENLRQSQRPGLALFSACFRSILQGGQRPSLTLTESTRHQGTQLVKPHIKTCKTQTDADEFILEELLQAHRYQTVAVLFSDAAAARATYQRMEIKLKEHRIEAEVSEKVNLARRYLRHFADVAHAKGLEFDIVILADIDQYDLDKMSAKNRVYVGITRARARLILLTHRRTLAPAWSGVITLYQECLKLSSRG